MSVMEPAEQAPESTDSIADEPVAVPEPTPPSIADGVERSLDPRSISLKRIQGGIFAGALSFGLLFPLVLLPLGASFPSWLKLLLPLLWLTIALALAWHARRWPVIEHRHASYKVDGRGIEIRRGVIWRGVVNVPRSRVQHTDVSQGPLERRYGLGTLVIYTAGTDHARVDLAGLDHGTALEIRDHLLPGEGEDAV
jgi:uncharacterized protein